MSPRPAAVSAAATASVCDLLVGLDGLRVTAVDTDGGGRLVVAVESEAVGSAMLSSSQARVARTQFGGPAAGLGRGPGGHAQPVADNITEPGTPLCTHQREGGWVQGTTAVIAKVTA